MDKKDYSALVQLLEADARLTEDELGKYFAAGDAQFGVLLDAQRYSIFSGGKRIRPALVIEFCRLFGGEDRAAVPFAAAIEMIHTYSLIHDDLPCMDNDDMRRGRPSCHREFGEANALLAGDSLLTYAFEVAAQNEFVSSHIAVNAVALLARLAGGFGMVGGQIIDLVGEKKSLDFNILLRMHQLKTGSLFSAAAALGCMAAGLKFSDAKMRTAMTYAEKIGLTFQIIDDILDLTGKPAMLGKECGGDISQNKTTFMTYFTPEEAKAYAAELTEEAVSVISDYPDSDKLCGIAFLLLERNH